MPKYIKLTPSQKDEIRRLSQLANRRIKAAERAYRKEGKDILPQEVTGKHQIKSRWATKSTPISRSVKFETEKDYRKQLEYLRSFEVQRPGIKQYTNIQQQKTLQAVETSFGKEVPQSLQEKLSKMTAPQLTEFWNKFSGKASKLGIQYSSGQAMQDTMNELYPEDLQSILAS